MSLKVLLPWTKWFYTKESVRVNLMRSPGLYGLVRLQSGDGRSSIGCSAWINDEGTQPTVGFFEQCSTQEGGRQAVDNFLRKGGFYLL